MHLIFRWLTASITTCCVFLSFPAFAISVNPVIVGGAYDSAPFTGAADGTESTPFIGYVSTNHEAAVYEFDLAGTLPGIVSSAALTGTVAANNSFDTGTRIHNVDVYTGNGTLDLADYNVPGVRVGSFSHASGASTDFNIDTAAALQSILNSGARKVGVRISAGADPQGYDVLDDTFNKPTLKFSVTPYGSATANIASSADAQADLTSGSYQLDVSGTSILTQSVPSVSIDRRGIVEFSLGSIPAGSNITGAKLTVECVILSGNATNRPSVPVYGYAGNGTTESADATQTANKIGQSDTISTLGLTSIDLNADYIESLLGSATHVGFLVLPSANSRQFGFASREFSSFLKPTLALTYLPPVGDYNSSGTVTADDYTAWRSKFSSTGISTSDGNYNGVVDAADYVVWRNLLSAPASGSADAVPEPQSLTLFLFAAFSLVTTLPRRTLLALAV